MSTFKQDSKTKRWLAQEELLSVEELVMSGCDYWPSRMANRILMRTWRADQSLLLPFTELRIAEMVQCRRNKHGTLD